MRGKGCGPTTEPIAKSAVSAHRHHGRAQKLHAGDVRRLLGDVDLAHVDLAFQAEIGGGRGQRHAVLARAGFGHQLLLAHVFGQKPLGHAVVELMRAGVVQILALGIDLGAAAQIGQVLEVADRGRAALEMLADIAQLGDEIGRFRQAQIGVRDFLEMRDERRRQVRAAIFTEETFGVGCRFQIPHEKSSLLIVIA